jgi:dipeptide/tripeptide permease
MIAPAADPLDRGFFGHPRGLSTLFFTEMWERFSYYGCARSSFCHGGTRRRRRLGFTDARAASIYGTYTGSAWAASIVGGLVADRLLGQYRTVLVAASSSRPDISRSRSSRCLPSMPAWRSSSWAPAA